MKEQPAAGSGYRLMDHTADVGIAVFASTPKGLYETAARALSDLLVKPVGPGKAHTATVDIQGADRADLMVNWLRELLYLWVGKGQWPREARVEDVTPTRLSATIRFEPYDSMRHAVKTDIKAVTYHQIQVHRTSAGWEACVIFDV